MRVLRPWGHIDWLLDRLPSRPWALLASCGNEERSVALATYLTRNRVADADIVAIQDPDPLDLAAHEERIVLRRKALEQHDYQSAEIHDVELLASLDDIVLPVKRLKDRGATAIVIDLTSMPKRWFFPAIKAVLADRQFRDVMVTYTSAESYSDQLSENLAPLRVLPGFAVEDGRTRHDSIVVGIGFEPLGLVRLLSEQASGKIRLIFPFPPGPPGHRRNWMFVKEIEDLTKDGKISPPDVVYILFVRRRG